MKLSIITINYNNKQGLENTIQSVICQTFTDYEYIIIDGGSNDGSVDVIKKYESHVDFWVSEKDNGIYNAMNKGVKVAKGDYCLFMNSSDTLYKPDTLQEVFSEDINVGIIYGDLMSSGHIQRAVDKISFRNLLTHTIGHQSSFIKRSLLLNNPYDENLKIVSDWKFFFQELIINNVDYKRVNTVIAVFDVTGVSMNNQQYLMQEREQELKKIFPPIVYEEICRYFGANDKYYDLFINIGESANKKRFYNTIVVLLKVFMLNRGWVRKLSLIK